MDHQDPTRSTGSNSALDADAASGSNQPLVDWQYTLSSAHDDQQLADDLIAIFLEETPKFVDQVRHAVEHRDSAELRLAAHSVKGSVRYFRADSVSETAARLELMGAEERWEGIDEAHRDFQQAVGGLLEYLRTAKPPWAP